MSNVTTAAHGPTNLRQQATKKLSTGGPAAGQWTSQSEALAVLHRLGTSPETASDALALLHELQVHQVELDLQQEELQRSQIELQSALIRQTDLVERAPVGYMTIDADTVLYEINLAGLRLLGAAREALLGRRLSSLLTPESAAVLQGLLANTPTGGMPESCELQLVPLTGQPCTVQAVADRDSTPDRFLLVLMPRPTP